SAAGCCEDDDDQGFNRPGSVNVYSGGFISLRCRSWAAGGHEFLHFALDTRRRGRQDMVNVYISHSDLRRSTILTRRPLCERLDPLAANPTDSLWSSYWSSSASSRSWW